MTFSKKINIHHLIFIPELLKNLILEMQKQTKEQ